MSPAINAIVSGIVQGVSFRYYTRRKATDLGLTGFVRNLPNGTVEVYAEGPETDLEALINWLHQGPSYAVVDQVNISHCTATNRYRTFDITR
ncbi:MAG: acylphosphatase [Myxococcota bacterium]|nr:acylphosphatase [Myxococcota bacterium]